MSNGQRQFRRRHAPGTTKIEFRAARRKAEKTGKTFNPHGWRKLHQKQGQKLQAALARVLADALSVLRGEASHAGR